MGPSDVASRYGSGQEYATRDRRPSPGVPVRKLIMDVSVDLNTTRLIRLCQAAELDGQLPDTTAKALVRQARAARAYAEAGHNKLARSCVQTIGEASMPEDYAELAEALQALCERTLSALR
jgi:hypothetical protein